ncbi:hypothetical protein [Paenibacillus cremeus]|uniref:Uncharacterized protein n=1 Tax=Paenibacillus cremeus TaxID=2163881 RepID=A0A559KFH8_9BACL|nr:hypothetical protein [Paenibacillus cremeus]TVY10880.1 hypothetical protein FPZ49_05185 [Paenibacillus cremeus]
MTFTLTGWMLYSMLIMLGLMGLDMLFSLFKSLKSGSFSFSFMLGYLQDMLFYFFPMFLISNMMSLDPTGWFMMIFYYLGALGVALKYLSDLKNKM